MYEIYIRIEPCITNKLSELEENMIYSYIEDLNEFRRRGQHVLELSPNRQAVLKITHYKKKYDTYVFVTEINDFNEFEKKRKYDKYALTERGKIMLKLVEDDFEEWHKEFYEKTR